MISASSESNSQNQSSVLDLDFIQAVAKISATVLDLDDLLSTGLDMLAQACPYRLAAFIFVNDDTNQPAVRASQGELNYEQAPNLAASVKSVLDTGQVIHQPRFQFNDAIAEEATCLVLPLNIGRLVTGAFIFVAPEIPVQTEQLLTIFVSQMTVAITNAKLYQRVKEQQQQEVIRRQVATHLQQLTTIINATLNLDEVLQRILARIEQVIPYNSALIMLLEGQNLAVQAATGFHNPKIKAGFKIPILSEGFYYHILSQQYPTVIHDIGHDNRYKFKPVLEVAETKAWIGAPLVIKNQVIGLLSLHHQEANYFDSADSELVNTFANQAAIAIDNAQVYHREQEKVKQFQTVARIGRQATEIYEVQPLLKTVIKRLHDDLQYEFVTILLYNPELDALVLSATSDLSDAELQKLDRKFPLDGEGVFSTAGRTGEPLVISDVRAFDGYILPKQRKQVRSELAIPLISKGQLIGLLDIQSSELQAFSPNDLILAQTIADQIAVAISTATLIEDRDQRLAELLVFDDISGLMADPERLDTTLVNVLKKIQALFQANATAFLTLSGKQLVYSEVAGSSLNALTGFSHSWREGISGWAARQNQPVLVHDVAYDKRHLESLNEKFRFQIGPLLAMPVQNQGRVLGVIEVMKQKNRPPFSQDDQIILSFIAASLGVTMTNSRLIVALNQKVSQMAGLFEASRALTNLDLGEVLRIVVQQVVNLLNSETATVYLIDETDKVAVPGASFSVNDEHARQTVFEPGQGSIGWVVENQIPLRVNYTQNEAPVSVTAMVPPETHPINLLAVPLFASGQLIGILETSNTAAIRPFSVEDEAFITALAGQAAMAINNARLFETVTDRETFVRLLGEAGAAINQSLNLEAVLAIICHRALALFNVDAVSVWRLEDELLACLAANGLDAEQMPDLRFHPNRDESFIVEVYRLGKAFYQNQVAPSPYYLASTLKQTLPIAVIGIPLLVGEQPTGILMMTNVREANAFSEKTLGKAVIYANQVSSAIENALLHQETSIRLAEVSTLYTLAHQMTINVDIDHLLEGTLEVVRLALDSTGGAIFLLHDDDRLILSAKNGNLSDPAQTFIATAVQKVIASLSPVNVRTPVDFASIGQPQPDDIKSLLMVPLIAHGNLLGVLAVYDKQRHVFGPNEGRLLTIVAVQIASSLENSKLFNNLQRHASNLEKALSELQEFSRLQGEFVQNVSHELRTPLTFVKAYVDLVLEENLGPISDSIRDSLKIVARRTEDLDRLVSEIISHQRLETMGLEFASTDLNSIINLAVNSAKPTAEQNHLTLQVDVPQHLPMITADANRISQVFDNLIGNAIKFTPSGGTITVQAQIKDDFIEIGVRDTGIGMAKDELEKVFKRFYQVDGSTTRRFKGTGLGLTIVKQIIEAHHGNITIESEPNVGTEFRFSLPLTQPEQKINNQ